MIFVATKLSTERKRPIRKLLINSNTSALSLSARACFMSSSFGETHQPRRTKNNWQSQAGARAGPFVVDPGLRGHYFLKIINGLREALLSLLGNYLPLLLKMANS